MAHDVQMLAAVTGGVASHVQATAMVSKSSELKESNIKLLRKAFPKLGKFEQGAGVMDYGDNLHLKFEHHYWGGDFAVTVYDRNGNDMVNGACFTLAAVKQLKTTLTMFDKGLGSLRTLRTNGAARTTASAEVTASDEMVYHGINELEFYVIRGSKMFHVTKIRDSSPAKVTKLTPEKMTAQIRQDKAASDLGMSENKVGKRVTDVPAWVIEALPAETASAKKVTLTCTSGFGVQSWKYRIGRTSGTITSGRNGVLATWEGLSQKVESVDDGFAWVSKVSGTKIDKSMASSSGRSR